MPANIEEQYLLTEEQKQHWLEHGFIKLSNCFSREAAAEFTSSIWTRLGVSPTDKSTWTNETINMPGHTMVNAKEFAPKAWYAICELVGGEDRVADWCKDWKDGFIVNMGNEDYKPTDPLEFRSLDRWHSDGDWFVHFLDSWEQALLVIPLFSDIETKGGGTAICTDGIAHVAKHLYDHPEGTWASFLSRSGPDETGSKRLDWFNDIAMRPELTRDESFHEATGEVGDVYILHPFMLHSASRNLLRNVRIITNPPVTLKEPFNFNRPDSKYSLVEQKTLRDLGRPEGLPEWKIGAPRERISTERWERQDEMKRKELERLAEAGIPVTTFAGAKPLGDYYPS